MSGANEFDGTYMGHLASAGEHWWVRGMHRIAQALLDERRTGLRVLDAGAGVGANLGYLEALSAPLRAQAIDVAETGVNEIAARFPAVDVLLASVAHLPFREGTFDLVLCIDVLQHLRNDVESIAVSELRRVLRSGGRLLVRTGSRTGRRAVSDRPDWRLYTPTDLRVTLERGGFAVRYITPVNVLGVLGSALTRPPAPGPDNGGHRPEWGAHGLGIPRRQRRPVDAVLEAGLALEARWVRGARRTLPIGHSVYALAERLS